MEGSEPKPKAKKSAQFWAKYRRRREGSVAEAFRNKDKLRKREVSTTPRKFCKIDEHQTQQSKRKREQTEKSQEEYAKSLRSIQVLEEVRKL